MSTDANVDVEVVLALPDRQCLIAISVPRGSTINDAIAASKIADKFPDVDLADCASGIWGRPLPADTVLRCGDRVELYRDLLIDPREARRELARVGRTMKD